MATFPSLSPTYGMRKTTAPNNRIVKFADGYEHRILFGLAEHQNPKIYNLRFEVSETDADIIETFLDARILDQASFTFTPPGESAASQYVEDGNRQKTINYLNRATIQTTFREVFEP